ncbi:hypothetical protein GCM10010441_29740 [Kitasatospora paracochleata]
MFSVPVLAARLSRQKARIGVRRRMCPVADHALQSDRISVAPPGMRGRAPGPKRSVLQELGVQVLGIQGPQ